MGKRAGAICWKVRPGVAAERQGVIDELNQRNETQQRNLQDYKIAESNIDEVKNEIRANNAAYNKISMPIASGKVTIVSSHWIWVKMVNLQVQGNRNHLAVKVLADVVVHRVGARQAMSAKSWRWLMQTGMCQPIVMAIH